MAEVFVYDHVYQDARRIARKMNKSLPIGMLSTENVLALATELGMEKLREIWGEKEKPDSGA